MILQSHGEGLPILDWLRDWLEIYTWWEVWFVASTAAIVPATWLGIALMLRIPNDIIRTISIWSFIFTLVVGAALVDTLRKPESRNQNR